jgi:hypothetical protein
MAFSPAHPLLAGLVDDAAVFPPGNATMPDAVADHRAWRLGPYGAMMGRFLCPISRIEELRAELQGTDWLRLGLIADTGVAGLAGGLAAAAAEPRLDLTMVDIALPREADQVTAARATIDVLQGVRAFIELPRVPGWRDALTEVSTAGLGAKLRTGGLVRDAFPTESEVAAFLSACATAGISFKCTAGLHHAIRYTDRVSGFEHHGFLNILVATAAAIDGAAEVLLAELLAERDPVTVAALAARTDWDTAARTRLAFVGFGTCSLPEAVEDLSALGLVEELRP